MLGLRNPNHFNKEEPGKALEFGHPKKVEVQKIEEVKPVIVEKVEVKPTLVEEIKKKITKKK